jgi:hypothetical protein
VARRSQHWEAGEGGGDEERCCDFFWKKVAFSLTERKKIFHFR